MKKRCQVCGPFSFGCTTGVYMCSVCGWMPPEAQAALHSAYAASHAALGRTSPVSVVRRDGLKLADSLLAALVVIVIVLVSLFGCSKPPWPFGVEPPPAAYLSIEPKVPVMRVDVPAAQINSYCHTLFKDKTATVVGACARLLPFVCIVAMPLPDPDHGYTPGWIAAAWQHEKYGHCNGLIHPKNGQGWVMPKTASPTLST